MELPINYTRATWQERKAARLEYIKRQDGKCHYCKCDLSGPPSKRVHGKSINKKLFPKSFWLYPVHLHHCHRNHMTIGAVHNTCNAVLWQYHGE